MADKLSFQITYSSMADIRANGGKKIEIGSHNPIKRVFFQSVFRSHLMKIDLKSDSDRLLKRADSDRSEMDPKFSVTVHTRHVLSQVDLRSILRCGVNRPIICIVVSHLRGFSQDKNFRALRTCLIFLPFAELEIMAGEKCLLTDHFLP